MNARAVPVMHGARAERRRGRIVDLVAMALLLCLISVGFAETFDGFDYVIPATAGMALGVGIAVLAARRRWGIAAVAVVTGAAYFLVGGIVAYPETTFSGIPTGETLRTLAIAAVTSWKGIITVGAPVSTADGYGIVPFALVLVTAVCAVSAALRLRRPAWALVPILAAFALQAALGVSTTLFPLAQGAALAVISVGWLGIRHALDPSRLNVQLHGETTAEAVHGARGRRLVTGAAVIVVAATIGTGVVGLTVPEAPRAVLRDWVVPPLRVQDYASPLQSFRAYVRDNSASPQFTLTGLPENARVRLAALDAYTGSVLAVSDDGSGSGVFVPLRAEIPVQQEGEKATVHITVDDYDNVWVPTIGEVSAVTFENADAAALRRSSYINVGSDTVISTHALAPGDSYTVDAEIPAIPTENQLAYAEFATLPLAELVGVPDGVSDIAIQAMGTAVAPIEKVRALQNWLITEGYFSHGLAGDSPSLSGHGAVRIQEFLKSVPMVGDDEQYAVAMVLLCRQVGIPARAVMGWHADEAAVATGGDFRADGENLHAWVEIAFAGLGWVAFDVTPPEDKVPSEQMPEPKADSQPQVLQPPPPPQEPADEPLTVPQDRDPKDGKEDEDKPVVDPLVISIAIGAGVLALVIAPLVAIVVIKAMRRRRRQSADAMHTRISGGWDEVVDRARDLKVMIPAGITRAETAAQVAAAFAGVGVAELARSADARVFGPGEPSMQDAREFWADTQSVIHGMTSSRSRGARMRAKISLRSLSRRLGDGSRREQDDADQGKGDSR